MNLKHHIKQYFDLYVVVITWAAAGAFAPNIVAVIWSSLTFLLLLRTGNFTKILLGLIIMLVFSDSRMFMFNFAETAKVPIVILVFLHVIRDYRNYREFNNQIFISLLPFLLYAIAATLWSADTSAAIQKSISYALVCFSVPLVFQRALKQNEKTGIDLIMFFILVLGIGLLFYLISPAAMTIAGRYHGLLGNPNGLGIFQVILFPLCYLFWQQLRDDYDFSRILWLFILVFSASIILTGSRTALFAVIIFFVFSRMKYFSNWATILGFLALIVGFEYFMTQLPSLIRSLGMEEYFRLETLHKGSGRDVAWAFAWQQIDDVFFAGGGFGYTEMIYQINYDYLSRLGHQGNAHNSYLTLWLDTGLIGLILFIAGLIRVVFIGVKNSANTLPVIFAILFSTYYESWLAASLNPFTSLFFIVLTYLGQNKEAIKRNESENIPELLETNGIGGRRFTGLHADI